MTLAEGIRTHLASDAAIVAAVGDRIRPLRLAQGEAYPAITYQLIATTPRSTLDGATSRVRSLVQVTCWAESYLAAHSLAGLVRVRVSDSSGAWGGVAVLRCEPPEVRDIEPFEGGGAPALYGVALDLPIHHLQ
jgi:hypothetical protein